MHVGASCEFCHPPGNKFKTYHRQKRLHASGFPLSVCYDRTAKCAKCPHAGVPSATCPQHALIVVIVTLSIVTRIKHQVGMYVPCV